MSLNLTIDDFDSFRFIKNVEVDSINSEVLKTVSRLDEKTQIEPYIRSSIFDINDTPHGPTEITDILTTRLRFNTKAKYAGFILKGKSFKKITAQHISHQIYRLKKIDGLEVAILAYTGTLLDQPQEQFISTCKEINCDYSVWNSYDLARLFISEGFICPRDGNIIEGSICSCGYNPKRESLNLFQEEAINELKLTHELNQERGLVILPTASGKTRVAAIDITNHSIKSVLYIAHTYEILETAKAEFELYFDEADLKILYSKNEISNLSRITFISIQLLNRNLSVLNQEQFDYIIIDEFHHAAARTYLKSIKYFKFKFLLGLTATPFRCDRKDITEICNGNIIVNYELKDGVITGILSPYHYFGYFDDVDYSKIKHDGVSYDIGDLEKALIIPERDKAIINKWKDKSLNKPTIGFCCSHKHAKRCCQNFNEEGIKSAVYISTTTSSERNEIIEAFKKGDLKIIFTVNVLNEGVDFPFVESLLFMRPTESKRIFLQQLGRGLRRFHGKTKTIVLDFIGNFKNAFKIIEYFGLTPELEDFDSIIRKPKNYKELFNLPLGCEIFFDEKVINVFSNQALLRENITNHNIHRILVQQFINLSLKLDRIPTWRDIDRNCIIDSSIYKMFYRRPQDLVDHNLDIMIERGILK